MKYLQFDEQATTFETCFLVPSIDGSEIERHYINPYGLDKNSIVCIETHQAVGKKKTPVSEIKEFINSELLDVITDCKVKYLFVGDSEYFKVLAKKTKADPYVGYVLDSPYGDFKVIYIPNFRAAFYNPEMVNHKIMLSINGFIAHKGLTYSDPGQHIIHFAEYPQTYDEIKAWLLKLYHMKKPLTVDIECFSLKHYSAGIGTITFCWNEHEGIAFPVDMGPDSKRVRQLLIDFFEEFNETLIYHNIAFDVYVLIYQLFMKDLLDTEGLLYGLEVMLKNWHDTKLITYLATNSCAGNKLSLKEQAQEFAGNYAVDEINDITQIPMEDLLRYNLVDGLSTWFTYNKHYDTMVKDQQLEIYETLFKPAIVDIIQMQLTGMPIDMEQVKVVKKVLETDFYAATTKIRTNKFIQEFEYNRVHEYVDKKNSTWKTKRTTVNDILELAKTHEVTRDAITFNPNSGPQLQQLLYEQLGLPVVDRTDSKQPATGADTLKKLKAYTNDQLVKDFLDAMVEYNAVYIILNTFIPAFEEAQLGPDGWHYLFGNFNLGGTVSGRLSSSKPNLQNLPATGSRYAKLIKTIFKAPPGWLFCGLDFASLEDRISALTTKDPQKLKVYTDGYDGHCLRAYAYFGEQMPDIDPNSVDSINSIADKYKSLRQDSKVPTFSLTYAGTYITIMASCGFTKEMAQQIERNYHVLYSHSDEWVQGKLDQASKDGYVTVAFGLRVRTPLLAQVIRGTSKTPFEAEAEGRTAGNALGQSWCLLNSRASSEFMGKVRQSKFRLDIRPSAQIHDASYYLVRDDMGALMYANEHLVKAVQWQDHPDIQHPDVKLGGEFSIFYPDWSKEMVIPNHANQNEIEECIQKHFAKL